MRRFVYCESPLERKLNCTPRGSDSSTILIAAAVAVGTRLVSSTSLQPRRLLKPQVWSVSHKEAQPNRPRVWDFCCDSRGNSNRTDMHTQAEQRAHEIEASSP
jgi:hypothetical protein